LPVIGTGVRHHAASHEYPRQHKRRHQGRGGELATAPPYRPDDAASPCAVRPDLTPCGLANAVWPHSTVSNVGYWSVSALTNIFRELYGRRGAADGEKGNAHTSGCRPQRCRSMLITLSEERNAMAIETTSGHCTVIIGNDRAAMIALGRSCAG